MAIGKPLLVSERKGVQQPVLSAQTQQLSANVPTQKIQFADYRIGQANVQASYAVGNELINMVDAGIKAKMYIDETKREYQRLNLMEEWQQSNIQHNERFAKANTLEAQQEVLDAYSKDNDARTANWRKVMPSTPDSEKYLSAIRTDSQKIHSKFSTTIAQTLNTRTDALEQLNIKRALTDLTTQRNADVVSKMNSIQTSLANRVKIGSLQPEQAEFAYAEAQKGVVAGRVNLFASDFADQNAVSGGVLPEDQDLYQMIENAVGLKIDDPDLLRSAKDSYEDAYYKRVGELNRWDASEETRVRNSLAQGKAEFESTYKQELAEMDGRTPDEWLNKIVDAGKRFDVAWPGYSQKLERELRNTKWGKASQTQIEYFTEGAGVEYIQQYVKRDGSYFINLEELDYLLRNQKGDHAGMNENTILGIVKQYRKQNDDIQKTVHKASEPILQSSLMSALKNPAILDQKVVNKPLWDAMHKPDFSTSLNWQNVFSLDPDYQTAFQTVKGLIQTAHDQGTGPFQDKYMQLPHNERIVHLEDFIQSQVGKVFGQVTAEKKKQAMQKQAQVESQGEREAQATMSQAFQAGSIDPRTKKRIPGAMAYRTASTAAELENQKIQSFANMKARIDKEIKRQDYDALSAPVKNIDQLIPDMPKVEIGPLKMSDIGSAIMGSVPTKYVAGRANKQLQDTIEEKLGRPLTEAELKGEDSNVNALASELIKEKEKSTLGKVFDWLFSDGSPSESELMMDNLLLDIKFKSLDGINRGVEKTQPASEAQPDAEATEGGIPVADQPAVDQLAEGMAGNPFMKTLVRGANQLFGAGAEAEATQINPPPFSSFDPSAAFDMEVQAEPAMAPSVEEPVPDKSGMYPPPKTFSQVETAPTPNGQGNAFKNLDTLDTGSKKESQRKFEEIKNLSERDTILFFEGHPVDAKFQTKGVHEGPYGISLKNFNAYTGKKYKVNDQPSPEDVEIAYNAHMEKAVMPIIADLEKYVQFSSNEKRALISLLWNGAKGSKTLKPIAKNAYKAFQAGDKATAYAELFSSTKGLRKSGGKVIKGLVNRRAAEWLLAEMGGASGSSPATNISSVGGATKKAYDLFSDPNTAGQNLEEKLRAIRELVADKEGRVKEELASKELLELQKHLDELMHFKENLALDGQELRTGEIQEKDIENYQLNRNPVYEGKDPQRNRRNI